MTPAEEQKEFVKSVNGEAVPCSLAEFIDWLRAVSSGIEACGVHNVTAIGLAMHAIITLRAQLSAADARAQKAPDVAEVGVITVDVKMGQQTFHAEIESGLHPNRYDAIVRAVLSIDAAADARAEEQEPQVWQPIETAPKDGTYVLIGHDREHFVLVAGFHQDEWRVEPNDRDYYLPTHWRPAPPAPHYGKPSTDARAEDAHREQERNNGAN